MSKQRHRQILARDLEALSIEFAQAVAADQAAHPCSCHARPAEAHALPALPPTLQARVNAMNAAMTLCLNGRIEGDRVVPMAREVLRFLEGD